MIQAIIFDVGGVLKTETDDAIQRDVMQTLHISPEVFHEPWRTLTDELGRGLLNEDQFWKQLLSRTGAKKPLPDESLLMREYKKGFQVHDDVLEIVHRLQNAGYKTAILSNTIACHANFNRAYGLYNGFNATILSHEVGLKKPSPEIFTLTLQSLGITAEESLLVDDLEKNIVGAEAIGMHGVLFTNAVSLEEELKKMGLIF